MSADQVTSKTLLDAHVHGAIAFVVGQGADRLGALAFRNFQFVAEAHGGETKILVVSFDTSFDFGFQIV
jgi:hypothetical protein